MEFTNFENENKKMVEYKCSGCDYTSSYEHSVKRHINKTKPCVVGVELSVVEIESVVVCETCGGKFKNIRSKQKHLEGKKCNPEQAAMLNTLKGDLYLNLKSEIDELKNENKELREQIAELFKLVKERPKSSNQPVLIEREEGDTNEYLCENKKDVFITPESQSQLKSAMAKYNNFDDYVTVRLKGNVEFCADISNEDFIELTDDGNDTRYYYTAEKGNLSVKELRVYLVNYCLNESVVTYKGMEYCRECYNKQPNVSKYIG